MLLMVAALALQSPSIEAAPAAPTLPLEVAAPASSSTAASQLAAWVQASNDNHDLPFVIIDKVDAELYLFDSSGRAAGSTPVLIGIAKGDESMPGVGDLPLSRIPASKRTTPAGRFLARYGPADGHADVLWVSFADSVALHPVVTSNKKEQRMQRLLSPSPDDNRITYGCINVLAGFYNDSLRPLLLKRGGVVYILPESRSLDTFRMASSR